MLIKSKIKFFDSISKYKKHFAIKFANQSSVEKSLEIMKFLAVFVAIFLALALSVNGSPACRCPRNYEPVCGSDSVTYNNPCEFDCVADNLRGLGKILTSKMGPC